MVKSKVQAHKEANAALQKAIGEQVKFKGEVQDLSGQLQSTLNQIHKLSIDLATTRSLLDPLPRRQQDDGGASTSKGQKWLVFGSNFIDKGEKRPSLASNRKAPFRGPSVSL